VLTIEDVITSDNLPEIMLRYWFVFVKTLSFLISDAKGASWISNWVCFLVKLSPAGLISCIWAIIFLSKDTGLFTKTEEYEFTLGIWLPNTFIEEYGLQNRTIDFIHIDAQGVDLDVLQSLGKYIENVKEGVIETVLYEEKSIYASQNNNVFENVKKFLKENHFEITRIDSNDLENCEYNVFFKKL